MDIVPDSIGKHGRFPVLLISWKKFLLMSMIIANNLNSLAARNSLNRSNASMAESLTRLSTGYKINSGKDDPAGFVISEQLRAQNAGLHRAVQNTQEAGNVLSIAEGALSEMGNILNKMRQLAVHSANNGVTSPEQVAADQAEVDSSIQTIDRIARTTKYSDEFLLNGNKKIVSDTNTKVTNTLDMKLLNDELCDYTQIFKKDDYRLNIAYASSDSGENEAQKGFVELSAVNAQGTQLNSEDYTLTGDQAFTVGGDHGSRYFSFAAGTHIGEMVDSINNAADSTGVEATLIYDADVESTKSTATVHTMGDSSTAAAIAGGVFTQDISLGDAHASGSIDFFQRDADGNIVTAGGLSAIALGEDSLAPAGTSSYGYSWSAPSAAAVSSFTTSGDDEPDDVITMQFANLLASDFTDNQITLKVEGGGNELNAYNADGQKLNSSAVNLGAFSAGDKIEITLDQNVSTTGTIYLGYDSVIPGATSLSDASDATRPFAGNGIWKDAADIGGAINFDLVTDIENASMLGAGNTIAIDTSGLESQFNISGGTSAEALTAIQYNITQALDEWQDAFNKAGFNVTFTYSNGALNDGVDGDDALGAVVDTAIDYTNTIRIGMTNLEQTSSKEAGVAAVGGYAGDSNNKFGALVFDSNDSWDLQTSSGSTINLDAKVSSGGGTNINFYDVIMHELGHVFGFAHPQDLYGANGLMSYNDTYASGDVYDAGTTDGAIINQDQSWRDPFMEDGINSFYNDSNNTRITTSLAGSFDDGDELTLTILSGPTGSGFSGASVAAQPLAAGSVSSGYIDSTNSAVADEEAVFGLSGLSGVAASEVPVNTDGEIVAGYNTDGLGRVYLKMGDDNSYTVYKDQQMTMAVAEGNFGSSLVSTARAVNNSGLNNVLTIQRDGTEKAGYTAMIQLDYMQEDVTSAVTGKEHAQGVDMSDLVSAMEFGGVQTFTLSGSYLSGVDLGNNTSDTGEIFVKVASSGSGTDCKVSLYSSEDMSDDSLVAQSASGLDLSGVTQAVRLYAVVDDDTGYDTGLYGSLNIGGISSDTTVSSSIHSTMLAARLSTVDYGSSKFVDIDQEVGALWNYTDATGNTHLLDAGLSGASYRDYGADAQISVNGQEMSLDGISGVAANLDANSKLVFNQGDLGTTTIAAVGYDRGTYGSRAGEMIYDADDADNLICHATGSTTETTDDFKGGMQFQLGEGSGEQERTVIGLKSMTATDIGKVWGKDNEFMYCLNDLMSGGIASLSGDPLAAMEIIDQAIDDVSAMRADIGAWQYNLLDTNSNNLNVAIENITKTESYIRDADMARESTDFSRNQIMVQSGTSMLAQANQLSQNVLSLIG